MNDTNKQPRVRVFRTWYEATMPLRERDGKKWLQFYDAVMGHALDGSTPPAFEDAELAELWERTNIRPYDATTDKPGWVKVWARKRRAEI